MRSDTLIALAVLALIATPDTSCAGYAYDSADMRYELVDLGLNKWAHSVNDNGQIVGIHYGSGPVALLFDTTGQGNHVELGSKPVWGGPAYYLSWPNAINNEGQIVGWERPQGQNQFATLFDASGGGANIYLNTSDYGSEAYCINNAGQIVGSRRFGTGFGSAAVFDPTGNGADVNLGRLGDSGFPSRAMCINDKGAVVGTSSLGMQASRATLFDATGEGENIDLGTLGGQNSHATCINNLGQIVGQASNASNRSHAALFDPSGAGDNTDLGSLGNQWSSSIAMAINDHSQIVGWSVVHERKEYVATLFTPDGPVDLNTLVDEPSSLTLAQAYDINNNGWIVGMAMDRRDTEHAFLLKPIPEPATVLLLGLGAAYLRRKSRPRHCSMGG